MPTSLTRITSLTTPDLAIELQVPSSWRQEHQDRDPQFVAVMPTEAAGPFADNLTIVLEPVPAETVADIDAVRTISLVQMHASVPDLHVIDDRPVEIDGRSAWFRASMQSTTEQLSVVSRQVFAVVGSDLFTLTYTSFPFRDPECADTFRGFIDSCRVVAEKGAGA